MTSTWVLVMFMTYDRSGTISTIGNLKTLQECQRVASVIKEWRQKSIDALCVETNRDIK